MVLFLFIMRLFISSYVWMWELDYEESWAPKNWCFWTVVLEKTHESSLDSEEIQPANSKGNQSWISIGGIDAEAEAPILWPPDVKNWLIWKGPIAGKDWRQDEKGTTEDGLFGWHHRLSGHEFEQAPGVGDGQGILVCCSPWVHKVRHDWMTEQHQRRVTLVCWQNENFIDVAVNCESSMEVAVQNDSSVLNN